MLWGILTLGVCLRAFQANSFNFYRDEALNAYRAFGWFDFLGTDTVEMTPLHWFTTPPWWSHLSFHDHPYLGFGIEHVFMSMFGDGLFAVRLPFIISGLLITYLIYRCLKGTYGTTGALVAAAVFSISSYAVWTALGALYEGFVQLFSLLTLMGVVQYTSQKKTRYLVLAGLSFGAALATKYTAIFLIPVLILFFLLWHRPILRTLSFYKDLLIAGAGLLLVLAPVIIYNVFLFQARGHFDIHLSRMLGIYSQDYRAVLPPESGFTVLQGGGNILQLGAIHFSTSSFPFALLLLVGALYLLVRVVQKRAESVEQFTLLSLGALMFLFTILPPETRYVPLGLPFLSIAVGVLVGTGMQNERTQKHQRLLGGTLIGILLFELAYSINTNVLSHPFGPVGSTYSESRYYALGFERFETWLRDLYGTSLTRHRLTTFTDLNVGSDELRDKPVIFYDDSMIWSAWLWHVYRYQSYYKLPLVSLDYLRVTGKSIDFMQALIQTAGGDAYFVRVIDPSVLDTRADEGVEENRYTASFEQALIALGAPHQDILNNVGVPVFRIYEVKKGSTNYLDGLVRAR